MGGFPTRLFLPHTCVALALACLTLSCQTPPPHSIWQPMGTLPLRGVSAHRGATVHFPENTLSGLREAVRAGAAQIEFDVRGTADGKLVIIHDSTVDRTTDGEGRVSQMTFDEIRQLDAGSWKSSEFAGERVPTLVEVLEAMPKDRWLNVNIKDDPWVAAEVARQLEKHGRLGQSFLAVGEDGARAALEAVPGTAIGYLDRKVTRSQYIGATLRFGAQFIQLHSTRGKPTRSEIERLRAAGVRVNFCCVETTGEAEELMALGVDFPLVDQLDAQTARLLVMPTPENTSAAPGRATPARKPAPQTRP